MEDFNLNTINYFRILRKRKWLIILTFLVCLVGTFVMLNMQTPIYEAAVKIRMGKIYDMGKIYNEEYSLKEEKQIPSEIKEEFAEILSRINSEESGLSSKAFQESTFNINFLGPVLYFYLQSPGKGNAEKLAKIVSDKYVDKKNQLYTYKKDILERKLSTINREIQGIRDNIETIKGFLEESPSEALQDRRDEYIVFFIGSLPEYTELMGELYDEKYRIEDSLYSANSFEILNSALENPNPILPKIRLNLIISSIMGLLLGIFLAFFVESGPSSQR